MQIKTSFWNKEVDKKINFNQLANAYLNIKYFGKEKYPHDEFIKVKLQYKSTYQAIKKGLNFESAKELLPPADSMIQLSILNIMQKSIDSQTINYPNSVARL